MDLVCARFCLGGRFWCFDFWNHYLFGCGEVLNVSKKVKKTEAANAVEDTDQGYEVRIKKLAFMKRYRE